MSSLPGMTFPTLPGGAVFPGGPSRTGKAAFGGIGGKACLFLCLFTVVSTGCDRPFVEQSVPTIEVVSPDPGIVQEEAAVTLLVKANSFRSVERITLGGTPFERLGDGTWRVELELQPGINRLILESFDSDDVAGLDTVQYLHQSISSQVGVLIFPDPRGGHTANMLPNGDLILVGGSRTTFTRAESHVFMLPIGGARIILVDARLNFARLGHTTTLLPDGRLLIAGGVSVPRMESVADLVETPEVFNPATGVMTALVLEGDPIRRAFHTAEVYSSTGGVVLTLLGGTGDVTYQPVSEIGVRSDVRSFQLVGDTLRALSPAIGPFVDLLTGHTQTPLANQPPGVPTRQLITGAIYLPAGVEEHTFVLDPRSPLGFEFEDLDPPPILRTEHAAALMAPGRVIRISGLTTIDMPSESSADIYDDTLGRFLTFGAESAFTPVARNLQTATNVGGGRILVLGGFDERGTALFTAEYITYDL